MPEIAPAARGCAARAGDVVEPSRAACGDAVSSAARGYTLGGVAAHGFVLAGAARGCALGGPGVLTMAGAPTESGAVLCSASNGLEPAQRGGVPASTGGCYGPTGAGTKSLLSRNSKSAGETGWECCSAKGKEDSSKIT